MYWVEIYTDGSYVYGEQEYVISTEGIIQLEAQEFERSGNDWAKIRIPFEIETLHGLFAWDVEVIEYFEKDVASFLGASIRSYPADIFLKEEVTFTLQDGWLNPKKIPPRLKAVNG